MLIHYTDRVLIRAGFNCVSHSMPNRLLQIWIAAAAMSAEMANAATPFFEFGVGRGEQEVTASQTGLTVVLDGNAQPFDTVERIKTDVVWGQGGLNFDTSSVSWLGPRLSFSIGGKQSSGDGASVGYVELQGSTTLDAAMVLADGTAYVAVFAEPGSVNGVGSTILPGDMGYGCTGQIGAFSGTTYTIGDVTECYPSLYSASPLNAGIYSSALNGAVDRRAYVSVSDGAPSNPSWKNWSHEVSERSAMYDARFETGLAVAGGVSVRASFSALYGTGDRLEARHQRALVQTPYFLNIYQTTRTSLSWRDLGVGVGAAWAHEFDARWGVELGAQLGVVQRETDAQFALRQEFRSISFFTGSGSDFIYETNDEQFASLGELTAQVSLRPLVDDIPSLKVSLSGSISYDTARPRFALDAPLLRDPPLTALTPGYVDYDGEASYYFGVSVKSEL